MAWDHLSITNPHLVYIILGGFTSLFMLCSSIIKERMYIGEATVATLCGVIFGPHAANLINPDSWGNVDLLTLEFSRVVLVVQCFAVGVELPKFYMERHWKSVALLLIPVMTFGWLVVSLFIWWLVPPLDWLESLIVAACVTATDPVLASSVVGKGKFAKRVPKHLRDLLSAESGCNDGMAFPFVYLGLYLVQDHLNARQTVFHWFVYTILYECICGAIFGFTVGYMARHAIKFAEERDLIDRESFLVFYFVLALFCAGAGSMLGMDDLLIGFAAGVGFSNDGWFHGKTEESHVSNVIDLLINLTYFVFLGTIIPWEQYNNVAEGLSAWRLVVLAIFVILFRRIPIMLALKTFIPDVKTWREALFAGHFGPIGVGAIFIAILARAELEYEEAVPLSDTPPEGVEHYTLVALIWPIVTFLVISSIIVHGSSIAVFTLGKHINTLNLTLSYTTGPEDGPSWLNKLPRLSSQSKSQAPSMSETSQEDLRIPRFPPGTLPPVGARGQLLQRLEGSDVRPGTRSLSSSGRRRRRSRSRELGQGGPVSQSAIAPVSRTESDAADVHEKSSSQDGSSETMNDSPVDQTEPKAISEPPSSSEVPQELEVYDEGDNIVVENQDGEVLAIERSPSIRREMVEARESIKENVRPSTRLGPTWDSLKRAVGGAYSQEMQKRQTKDRDVRKHEPARAYQFGNTIVIEDREGEVIKQYELPSQKETKEGPDLLQQCQKYLGRSRPVEARALDDAPVGEASGQATKVPSRTGWFGGASAAAARKKADNTVDDQQVRFTIDEQGKRMTKADFLQEVRKLDPKTRREMAEKLSGSHSHAAVEKQASPPEDPAWPVQESQSTQGSRQRTTRDGGEFEAKEMASEPQRPTARASSKTMNSLEDETPAERRRREAALGVGTTSRSGTAGADEDSEDEGTPRVPPSRRGIRFAEDVRKTRQGK